MLKYVMFNFNWTYFNFQRSLFCYFPFFTRKFLASWRFAFYVYIFCAQITIILIQKLGSAKIVGLVVLSRFFCSVSNFL